MIIYKDILTDDEMFTDSMKIKLVDDCLYEVYCKHVTRKQGGFVLDGANPSAEGEDDDGGCDDGGTESGLDIVLNQQLIETGFTKEDYMLYLKTYSKALQAKWKEEGKSEAELEECKNKFMQAVKLVKPKLAEAKFYLGSSSNADGMVGILDYREDADGNEQPIMMFYKHGLLAEKV